MNQLPSFILAQNFGTSNGAGINITDAILNSINYTSPSQQNLTLMESPDQSFQVINQYEIALQLGFGTNGNQSYSALLATISSPCAFAVDPAYVLDHGGVVANSPNTFMQTNALGTGFYELSSWIQGQSVKLVSQGPGFKVSSDGRAINNALEGQIAQVRSASGQVISGVARAGGIIEVNY